MRLSINKLNISFKLLCNNLLVQIFISFLLARITNEWYLLSRFDNQIATSYELLWNYSGYFLATLVVLWLSSYSKSIINDLSLIPSLKDSRKIDGSYYSYTLLFINLFITLIILFFFYILLNIQDFLATPIDITIIYFKKMLAIRNYKLLIISIFLLINQARIIVYYAVNITYIMILGRMWFIYSNTYNAIDGNLISNISITEISLISVIIILYCVVIKYLALWYFHSTYNNLSEWSSYKISRFTRSRLNNAYLILPVILFFFIGM